jgi:Ankyrin repeats (3 copies)/Ankyrin repeat
MRAMVTVLCALLWSSTCFGGDSKEGMTLEFDGVQYFHRWSKEGQHEFTPRSQEDLERWADMVTIDVHETVRDGDELAALANAVLGRYQAGAKVLKTDSKPRTKDHPAEHFVAAVLGHPAFLEAAFSRFLLVEGHGMVAVYSHRVYGAKAGPEMSRWLDQRGAGVELALGSWAGVPSLDRLRGLSASSARMPAPVEDPTAKVKREEAIRELAEYGYTPRARGTEKPINGGSLVLAAGDGHEDLVKLLLAAGVPVDAPVGSTTRTALLSSVEAGYLDIAATLLKAGANVNVRDENGLTPLIHLAKYCDEVELVRTFMKRGADVNAASLAGWTPLKEADMRHCGAIAAELRKAGARK